MGFRDWFSMEPSSKDIELVGLVERNRPTPIRKVDQIYMQPKYVAIQTRVMGYELSNKRVVFMGDGDGMSLMFGLYSIKQKYFPPPDHMLVLDFDKRILKSIREFAKNNGFDYLITTKLYNVKWEVPEEYTSWGDFFYTNPAYGSKTEPLGRSGG